MFDVIEADLKELNEGLIGAVTSPVDLVTEIGTHLVTAGGKRIRPALCLLAAHGGPLYSLERLLPLAEALEQTSSKKMLNSNGSSRRDFCACVINKNIYHKVKNV